MLNGVWHDWIEGYLAYTEGVPSPEIFRLWTGIAAVAGALERRVWAQGGRTKLYPNLYTLLVASPGVGKNVITNVSDLWYATRREGNIPAFRVAPDNVSKASLIDALAEADCKRLINGNVIDYHSLLVAAPEFGVFISAHDLEFLSPLNYIFDCPDSPYREKKRSLSKEIEISRPQMNILAGTQPSFLATILPEEAWTMGFTSRIIMIYAANTPYVPLFSNQYENLVQPRLELIAGLSHLSGLYGPAEWDVDAQDYLTNYHKAGLPPIPEHSRLQHYIPRRIIHLLKLCMVSAVSRSGTLQVTLADVYRARDWLLDAEAHMPDIFREMVGKSDHAVIGELHHFLWGVWLKGGKKPISKSRIYHFLSAKLPSEKVYRVIDVAERSGVIARIAGTENDYIPKEKAEWGLE